MQMTIIAVNSEQQSEILETFLSMIRIWRLAQSPFSGVSGTEAAGLRLWTSVQNLCSQSHF